MASEMRRSPLPRRLSPAAIDRYRGCPHTAHLQFVAKAESDHVVTPSRAVGNAIHEALDRFFALDPTQRSEEGIHNLLRSAWRKQPRDKAFSSEAEEGYYGRQALEQLSRFVHEFEWRERPFGRERWMEAPLPNGSIVYGKVDRVDLRQTAGSDAPVMDVVDYKSGRSVLDNDELPTDSAAQTYLLGTEWQTKAEVRRVRYIYLASGQEARWEVEREDVEAARERLNALTWAMHTDETFEPRPGQQCGLCPFAAACDYSESTAPGDATPADQLSVDAADALMPVLSRRS